MEEMKKKKKQTDTHTHSTPCDDEKMRSNEKDEKENGFLSSYI